MPTELNCGHIETPQTYHILTFNPGSDQCVISPYNVNTFSTRMVTRKEKKNKQRGNSLLLFSALQKQKFESETESRIYI